MDKNVAQHFRKEELPFLKYSDDLVNRVLNEYRPILTDFLNPRQIYLLSIITNSYSDVYLKLNGGFDTAEMKRGIIYPQYFQPSLDDFQLSLFEIKYPVKFAQLHHSQILGSIMGTGVQRDVLGDILTDGTRWQFITEKRMADYFRDQLQQVGKIKVDLLPVDISKIIKPLDEWQDYGTTISSLRIDVVISNGFNLSRHQAKELVNHDRIHLNWGLFNRPDYELAINDILSIRGFGRMKVKQLNGKSKKGKLKVVISILKK